MFRSRANNKRQLVVVLLVAFLAVSVRFWPFFIGKTLYFGDNFSLMVPGKIYTAEWLKKGVLALWNPTILAGIPWISDINQSVLYPTTALFVMFTPSMAVNISIIVHLLFTFWGMYFLAKTMSRTSWGALMSAFVWMLSTQVAGSINNLSTIQSIAWFPWVVLGALWVPTRQWWIFPVSIGMQFLAGYPQHVVLAGGFGLITSFVFARKFSRKRLLMKWVVVGMITVIISSVGWLPFARTLLESTRMNQTSLQATAGSLHPLMMLKMLVPYLFDNPAWGIKWGPAWSGQPNMFVYVTWIGLLILGLDLIKNKLALKTSYFALVLGFSVIFSMGSYLPGFSLIQTLVPIFKVGRYPSMMMIVGTLSLCWWLGLAVETIDLGRLKRVWRRLSKGLFILIVILLVWLGVIESHSRNVWEMMDGLLGYKLSASSFHTPERDRLILLMVSENLIMLVGWFTISLWALAHDRKKLLLTVVVLDLIYNTQGAYLFTDSSSYDWQSAADEQILKTITSSEKHNFRILTRNFNRPYTDFGTYWEALVVRNPFSDSFIDADELSSQAVLNHLRLGMTPNWNMPHSVLLLNGYTTLLPNAFAQLWQNEPGAETRINFLPYIDPTDPLLDNWSVSYYLVDEWFDTSMEDFPTSGRRLTDQLVLYPNPGVLPRFRFDDLTSVTLTDFSENPNEIQFRTTSDKIQDIIVADRYDDDWKVFVNDTPVQLANHDEMRRFTVPEGTVAVKMLYVPRMFYLGLYLSGLGWVTMTVLVKTNYLTRIFV